MGFKKTAKKFGKQIGIGLTEREKEKKRQRDLARLEYERARAEKESAIRKYRQTNRPKPSTSSGGFTMGGQSDFFSTSGGSYFGGSYFGQPKAKPKKRKRKRSTQKIIIYR